MNVNRIFVYGTLKRGFPNYNNTLPGLVYRGTARTRKAYPLVVTAPLNVPVLILTPGEGHVVSGELFDVSDAGLDWLDDLEDVHRPGGYKRVEMFVIPDDTGLALPAQTWVKVPEDVGEVLRGPMPEYEPDPAYIPPHLR